jgi:hypothetical protein
VIDCVLPPDSPIDQKIAAAGQAQGVMGLELVWGGGHNAIDDHCPRTSWRADKERFTARERTGDHQRGLLRLESADDRWGVKKKQTSPFDVYQVDPDGAALKTVDFLLSAQNLVGRSLKPGADGEITYSTGDRQPVAALRSGGLGVTRHGRAAVIAQSAASAALKDQEIQSGSAAAKNVVLFAEDVLRGYRVDAQPLAGGVMQDWQSLCRRQGTYRFTGTTDTLNLPEDEGYVKGASTSSNADPAVDPDDHYLHESMFRWTGWSLVVPRPGRTMRARTDPDSGVQGEVPEDVTDEAANGNGLSVTFSVAKGSLPRLRFGTPYRLRARIVDLAGNSLALDDKSLETDPNASNPVTYWRFEAVDPPAMIHRARVSEGESLERMVIRSNWKADPAAYLGTPAFAAAIALPASADFEYTAMNERHLSCRNPAAGCEQHAMLTRCSPTPQRSSRRMRPPRARPAPSTIRCPRQIEPRVRRPASPPSRRCRSSCPPRTTTPATASRRGSTSSTARRWSSPRTCPIPRRAAWRCAPCPATHCRASPARWCWDRAPPWCGRRTRNWSCWWATPRSGPTASASASC